jgi:hypothetical protein
MFCRAFPEFPWCEKISPYIEIIDILYTIILRTYNV